MMGPLEQIAKGEAQVRNAVAVDTPPPPPSVIELGFNSVFIAAFQALATQIKADNIAKGFVTNKDNVGEKLMLVVSELSEGMEAWRKGNRQDDHLPHRNGLEVELADAVIRIMDMSANLGLDVATAIVEKLVYNRSRPFKHGKTL
jgi:NTP pyrophosphatase (non-canonical NTP hydrolase)